jgi:hypothetical protein
MSRKFTIALAAMTALGVLAISSSAFTQQIKDGSTGGGVHSKNPPKPKPKPAPKPSGGGSVGGIVSEGQGYGMSKPKPRPKIGGSP